jgi:hypothetical protein
MHGIHVKRQYLSMHGYIHGYHCWAAVWSPCITLFDLSLEMHYRWVLEEYIVVSWYLISETFWVPYAKW